MATPNLPEGYIDITDQFIAQPKTNKEELPEGYVDITAQFLNTEPAQAEETESSKLDLAGRAAKAGVADIASAVNTGLEWAGHRLSDKENILTRTGREGREYWDKISEENAAPEHIQGDIVEKTELLRSGDWWVYNLVNTGVSMIPGMIAGAGVGGAAAKGIQLLGKTYKWTPKLVNRLSALSKVIPAGFVGGGQEGTNTYKEVLKKTGSEEAAARAMEAMTTASGALNALSFGKMFNVLNPKELSGFRNYLRHVLEGGVTESITEYLEEPSEVLIKMGVASDKYSADELINQLKSGVNVIPPSFVMGGVMSGAGAKYTNRELRDAREIKKYVENNKNNIPPEIRTNLIRRSEEIKNNLNSKVMDNTIEELKAGQKTEAVSTGGQVADVRQAVNTFRDEILKGSFTVQEAFAKKDEILKIAPDIADDLNKIIIEAEGNKLFKVPTNEDDVPIHIGEEDALGTAPSPENQETNIIQETEPRPDSISEIKTEERGDQDEALQTKTEVNDNIRRVVIGETEDFEFPDGVSPYELNQTWDDFYAERATVENRNKPQIAELKKEAELLKSKRDAQSIARKKEIKQRIDELTAEYEIIQARSENAFAKAQEKLQNKILERAKAEGIEADEETIGEALIWLSDGRTHENDPEGSWQQPLSDQVIQYLKEEREGNKVGEPDELAGVPIVPKPKAPEGPAGAAVTQEGEAISEGKPVPEEILKDYPDLQQKVEQSDKNGGGYEPSHPWYYKNGGRVLSVDEIKPYPDLVKSEKEKYANKKPEKLQELRKQFQLTLDKDIKRYQELVEKGDDAISDYDKKMGYGIETSLSLKHNHIAYNKSQLQAINELLLNDNEPPPKGIGLEGRKKKEKSRKGDTLLNKEPPGGWTEADKVPKKKKTIIKAKDIDSIKEVFGEDYIEKIKKIYDDIVELYPYASYHRYGNRIVKTIGASKSLNNQFYVVDSKGSISLRGVYSGFPATPEEVEKQWGKEAAEYWKGIVDKYSEKQNTKTIESIKLAGKYDSTGDTEKDLRENGSVTPERKFKADLKKYGKKLQEILGYEPEKDKKGKDISVSTQRNQGHILLWKPNSEYGVYINFDGVSDLGNDTTGNYGNDTLIINDSIMWRATTKQDKWRGCSNQWINSNISAEEFAEKIKKEVDFYDRVTGAVEIIQEARDAEHTETEITDAFAEGEKAGEIEGANLTTEQIEEKIAEVAADIGVEVVPSEDLSAKSTGDLVKDMFAIINDHIGERGSISAKEIDETLYQKLKPYLAEIAKRAKAKMVDVRAYLFGAVDAMPDGKAKDIYETAARRYADEQDNEHYERLAENAEEKTPFQYGQEAFTKGLKAIPAHDSDFMESIATHDETIKSMKDWMKGWNQANLAAPVPLETKTKESPYGAVANWVVEKLKGKTRFTRNELFFACKDSFGGTLAEGKFSAKDAYDAMEMGINKFLEDKLVFDQKLSHLTDKDTVLYLKDIFGLIPTQTTRTEEMDEFQQFSTPPALAYVANWAANLNENDVYLEPSAGTGNIAIFGKIFDVKEIIVNELAPRRAEILKELGFDKVFTENAEQLNNILPKDIKPTVVVMNPPFSSTAGRIKGQRNTFNATVHIEQCLKRLQPGGRLVAIVGEGMAADKQTFKPWWNKISEQYIVRANVGISGQEYAKYGTTFGNQIIIIDKSIDQANKESIIKVTGKVDKIEQLIDLLSGVRNERIDTREQESVESGKQESSSGVKTETGRNESLQSATGSMVSGKQPGRSGRQIDNDAGRNEGLESGKRGEVSGTERGNKGTGRTGAVGKGERQSSRTGRSNTPDDTRQADDTVTELPEEAVASLTIEQRAEVEKRSDELSDSVYDTYHPAKLKIPGAKDHPGKLVESAAMASIEPFDPTYSPKLPVQAIKSGKISMAQLEAVVYAGQAHQETLPDGSRKGFFIGDGTGVGKGREIASILWDNWNHGRKKAIWFSQNSPLMKDAERDVKGIGWNHKLLFDAGKVKLQSDISTKEGIAFVGYGTLRSKKIINGRETSRLSQIVKWFGPNYDGVIIFDESHNMGNALAVKGKRGTSKPSATALAGVELQKQLPNARIVYVSATGATEVMNLAYASRLGLWGDKTPFPTAINFVSQISSGGITAMEMVAMNLKANGVYMARSLAYDDVKYERLEHKLTREQREIYDELAGAWQICQIDINAALTETNVVDPDTGATLNTDAKSHIMAQFWGTNQRFWNQVITAMQMPSAIKAMEKDIQSGYAPVIQLVNTNEAAQERAIGNLEEEDTLEDLDITPREMMMEYIKNSFPVYQFEIYEDEEGNKKSRIVKDSAGNPVINPEAVEKRDELLTKIGSIRVPDGPLEMLLDHFGVENVAEVTGRTRRVVYKDTPEGRKRVIESWGKNKGMSDADAFMDDRKKMIIFSPGWWHGKKLSCRQDS